uniref:BRO1 domain-containing protein n=1 Tax=Denticeps clupeoides TaxID=299321 RepID=A0AAY4D460_9TELE
MEAVPRMPMIWMDLKGAGPFSFRPTVKQFILRNYGGNSEEHGEALKKLESLRRSAVNVNQDFEGCSTLKKYLGQLYFLQSRVPMTTGQEAAVPVTWTDLYSGRAVTHDDIRYEQASVLFNLGDIHCTGTGMKVSCNHFQSAAGAFSYLLDHLTHVYSSELRSHSLTANIRLMLAQAQECLLEKSLLDNMKSLVIARICAQVVDYYKQCVWAMESADSSVLAKKEKEWMKIISMKIWYYSAIAQLHMGKQAEEEQKFGEAVAYFQSSHDRLNEAIKLSKVSITHTHTHSLFFLFDIFRGFLHFVRLNSGKKDNDFIYHETVPAADKLASPKGVSLVKPSPFNPTDPGATGPDLFSTLVPMAAHEASSVYSEEKAKLMRDVLSRIESQNRTLEQFMDSLCLDSAALGAALSPSLPGTLLETCAALSVRPNAVQSLVQAMQVLAGLTTEVDEHLDELRKVLLETSCTHGPAWEEAQKELERYERVHTDATHTNTELHTRMSQHLPNLRLLQGPVEELRANLPQTQLTEAASEQMQRILGKVNEMREQRRSLEQQLRELIHRDDLTSVLVTTERSEIKDMFQQQLQKYSELTGYIEQNLSAQEKILTTLTDANARYAPVRKNLAHTHTQWQSAVRALQASYEDYEDLLRKAEEGRDFYQGLVGKCSTLLDAGGTPLVKPRTKIPLVSEEAPETPTPLPRGKSCPPSGGPALQQALNTPPTFNNQPHATQMPYALLPWQQTAAPPLHQQPAQTPPSSVPQMFVGHPHFLPPFPGQPQVPGYPGIPFPGQNRPGAPPQNQMQAPPFPGVVYMPPFTCPYPYGPPFQNPQASGTSQTQHDPRSYPGAAPPFIPTQMQPHLLPRQATPPAAPAAEDRPSEQLSSQEGQDVLQARLDQLHLHTQETGADPGSAHTAS